MNAKLLLVFFLVVFSSSASAAWVFPDKSADVVTAKSDLKTAFDGYLITAKSMVSFNTSGLGSLPCKSFDVLGRSIDFCLDDYSSGAYSLGILVMFMAFLLSIYIFFR